VPLSTAGRPAIRAPDHLTPLGELPPSGERDKIVLAHALQDQEYR